MESTIPTAPRAPAAGARARGAARANLAGALGTVWASYGAPGSVLLTLFLDEWLHADKWQIGLVMTMTFLGPVLEPLGAYLVERLGRRRGLFLGAFLCNRVPFLALAAVPCLGSARHGRNVGIAVVLLVVGLTRIPAALGTPAWWSWMGDLVPERRRSRFFSCRQQTASTATAISFVAGMALLQTCGGMHNRPLVSALFGLGALFGISDILLYLRVPEPLLGGKARESSSAEVGARNAQPLTSLTAPFRHRAFRRLIMGMGLWSFSANLVVPFLPVYQRGELIAGHRLGLGLSWLFLAVLTVSASVAGMLTSRWWGRWIERLGPRRILLLGSGYLFINLAYLAIPPGHYAAALVLVAVVSGALTAAWTVSVNQLLLGVAPRANRSFYVSAYNCTNGLLMAGGPLLGGLLADRLPVAGWCLAAGLPFCYFHILLGLAAVGGVLGLTVLSRVPEPRPAAAPAVRVLSRRVALPWQPRHRRPAHSGGVHESREYATI
jgi:MFS family permease